MKKVRKTMYFLIEMWYNENKSIILVLIG